VLLRDHSNLETDFMSTNFRLILAFALFLVISSLSPAQAAIVGIAFDANAPTNWNLAASNTTSGLLIDESGNSTTAVATYGSYTAYNVGTRNLSTFPTHTTDLTTLTHSVVGSSGISISGLAPSTEIDLWVLSFHDMGFGGGSMNVTVNGSSFADFVLTNAGHMVVNGVAGSDANTLASYALPVTTSPTGTLEFAFTAVNTEISVAGIAFEYVSPATPIPVPPAAAMTLVALAGCMTRQLRRA